MFMHKEPIGLCFSTYTEITQAGPSTAAAFTAHPLPPQPLQQMYSGLATAEIRFSQSSPDQASVWAPFSYVTGVDRVSGVRHEGWGS